MKKIIVACLIFAFTGSLCIACTSDPPSGDGWSVYGNTYSKNITSVQEIGRQRTTIDATAYVTGNRCATPGSIDIGGGFGSSVTVDTSWEVELEFGDITFGTAAGGSTTDTIDLNTTVSVPGCASTTVPLYKYNVTVTMGINFQGYASTTYWRILYWTGSPPYPVYQYATTGPKLCGTGYAQTTHHTFELSVENNINNGCPEKCDEPCMNDLGGCGGGGGC